MQGEFLKDTQNWQLPIQEAGLEGVWASAKVCICFTARYPALCNSWKLLVQEQPEEPLKSMVCWEDWMMEGILWMIYISIFLFKQNQTNSCCVLLFTCYMSNIIVPKVLMRKD